MTPASAPPRLRLGFVTGTTPDKWARRWRERHPRGRLDLVAVEESDQERGVRDGDLDMCLARLPVRTDDLHVVRLYDEDRVVVATKDHFIAAAETVELRDLVTEQLITDPAEVPGWTELTQVERLDWPSMSPRDAIEAAASGTGIAIVPASVARLFDRRDCISRPLSDVEPTTIALIWAIERDDETTQEMVGITRGRTARSSRG